MLIIARSLKVTDTGLSDNPFGNGHKFIGGRTDCVRLHERTDLWTKHLLACAYFDVVCSVKTEHFFKKLFGRVVKGRSNEAFHGINRAIRDLRGRHVGSATNIYHDYHRDIDIYDIRSICSEINRSAIAQMLFALLSAIYR